MCSVGVKFEKLGQVFQSSQSTVLSVGSAGRSVEQSGLFSYTQEVFGAVKYPVTVHMATEMMF